MTMNVSNDAIPEDDSFAPIAQVLRDCAAAGTLPSLAFYKRCEEVGRQALADRKLIERFIAAGRTVPWRVGTVASRVQEVCHAAKLDEAELLQASELDSLDTLNQPCRQGVLTAQLLGIDDRFIRVAILRAAWSRHSNNHRLLQPKRVVPGTGTSPEAVVEAMRVENEMVSRELGEIAHDMKACDDALATLLPSTM